MGAMRAHCSDKRAAAGRQDDAFLENAIDNSVLEAAQQRDALPQGGFELDLAAHGALGNRRDLLLETDEIGQLVDTFLADHGGIHVREEQFFAPMRDRLDENIDRQPGECGANSVRGFAQIE